MDRSADGDDDVGGKGGVKLEAVRGKAWKGWGEKCVGWVAHPKWAESGVALVAPKVGGRLGPIPLPLLHLLRVVGKSEHFPLE